jgi:hypothetical protein
MGSDALTYPIGECLYEIIHASGQPIIKRVNQAGILVAMIGASRRNDEVYKTDIIPLKIAIEVLRTQYRKAFDLSPDDFPDRSTFEDLLYNFIEDCLFVVTTERLISGSMMEQMFGEKFKTRKKEED